MIDATRRDKFGQPVDAIEIVSRTTGPRTMLNDEALAVGQARIAAGEDFDKVVTDLALDEVYLLGMFDQPKESRAAGGPGSGNFSHAGRPGEIGGSTTADITLRQDEIDRMDTVLAQGAHLIDSDEVSNVDPLLEASLATRGAVKHAIVDDIVPRLSGMEHLENPTTFVQDRLNEWAKTSGDHDPDSVNMQHAVAEEFNLTNAAFDHLPSMRRFDAPTADAQRAYVRAEYENTQSFLNASGISHVSLFRGVDDFELKPGEQVVTMQPASSWSTSLDVAMGFATQNRDSVERHILTTRVPADRVLSTAVTGRGCLPEAEVLLLGGPTKVMVYRLPEGLSRDEEYSSAAAKELDRQEAYVLKTIKDSIK